jgi:ribosomal protein L37AE/L43A
MLHPDLQKLLDFALESGEVTEKHRQILHNKAISLNQDIDELEMIIEGEFNRLKKSKEGQKQKNYACPNCGSSIPSSSIKCGFCGFEISKTTVTGVESISVLSEKLYQIDKEDVEIEKKSNVWKNPYKPEYAAQKKASAISTFNMPNDKEHLLEFFLFCDNNADAYSNTSQFNNMSLSVNQVLYPAWAGKARLGYNKLKRFENEDDEIKAIIEKYKKKYHQEADDMRKVSINKKQGYGKAVIMGLNLGGVITFFLLLLVCLPLVWLPFLIPQFKAE